MIKRVSLILVLFVILIWVINRSFRDSDTPDAHLVETIFTTADITGEYAVNVNMKASDLIPQFMIQELRQNIRVQEIDPANRGDLRFWLDPSMEPDPSKFEVSIELELAEPTQEDIQLIWIWPEPFEAIRPGVIRFKQGYRNADPQDDIGQTTFPLHEGNPHRVTGQLLCEAPNGTGTVTNSIAFVSIRFGPYEAVTDAAGNFEFVEDFDGVPGGLTLVYDSEVPGTGSLSSRLRIMDEWHNERTEGVVLPMVTPTGDTLQFPPTVVTGGDCEIWRLGVEALQDYHAVMGTSPPAGELRIKRWWGVFVGGIYTFYDYIVLRSDFVNTNTDAERTETIRHEFGHSIRHVADGDEYHWNWDNFRFAYARSHDGTEIFNKQYAFNEGWAQYWEAASLGVSVWLPPGVPGLNFMDWNEMRIGEHLQQLATAATRVQMVQVLTDNPGEIHSLWEYEQKYCELLGTNPFCSSDTPLRPEPPSCPPGFIDDGLTCRFENILPKPSYGRGVGIVPQACGPGNEYDAGLCYPECRAGFNGVGPVCWAECPPGYHDDGLTCRRDAWIFGSDNSACPWWDVCGIAAAAGCSECPAGFHNDGCTCRRDADIFGKESYGRGVGWVPTSCQDGMEYDAGLCYPPCTGGFNGVGPVCWGSCPPGFEDHGATCYTDPNILIK